VDDFSKNMFSLDTQKTGIDAVHIRQTIIYAIDWQLNLKKQTLYIKTISLVF